MEKKKKRHQKPERRTIPRGKTDAEHKRNQNDKKKWSDGKECQEATVESFFRLDVSPSPDFVSHDGIKRHNDRQDQEALRSQKPQRVEEMVDDFFVFHAGDILVRENGLRLKHVNDLRKKTEERNPQAQPSPGVTPILPCVGIHEHKTEDKKA